MKTITLTQPWATLVATGAKKIETRSWATAYRGPLAIHAAKGLGAVGGKAGLKELCWSEPFASAIGINWMPLGAIIATCNLVDCQPMRMLGRWDEFTVNERNRSHVWRLTDNERAFGDYTPGRYAWLLADVRMLPDPVPARGALGLWEYNQ